MKVGIRKRSFKKSFSARTKGNLTRRIKKATTPFYGKKGVGWVKDPKRALYNKVYRKTTISLGTSSGRKKSRKSAGAAIWAFITFPFVIAFCAVYYVFAFFAWAIVQLISIIVALIKGLIGADEEESSDADG